MSTLAYSTLTAMRIERPNESRLFTDGKKSSNTYLDALAALVPAEVLAAFAVIFETTSEERTLPNGSVARVITDPSTLKWSFIALVVVSVILFVVPRVGKNKFEAWDAVRAVIPPIAFVGWTMLLPLSAFDTLCLDLSSNARFAIPVIGALVLGVIAARLAAAADEKDG
jgi:hypothetical protein